jgi:hypothetical protein
MIEFKDNKNRDYFIEDEEVRSGDDRDNYFFEGDLF